MQSVPYPELKVMKSNTETSNIQTITFNQLHPDKGEMCCDRDPENSILYRKPKKTPFYSFYLDTNFQGTFFYVKFHQHHFKK